MGTSILHAMYSMIPSMLRLFPLSAITLPFRLENDYLLFRPFPNALFAIENGCGIAVKKQCRPNVLHSLGGGEIRRVLVQLHSGQILTIGKFDVIPFGIDGKDVGQNVLIEPECDSPF